MARRWTDKELRRLEQYLVDEMSYRRIALKLNRSLSSIKSKVVNIGISRQPRRQTDELNDIIQKFNEGMLTKQIARIHNTSCANIRMVLYNARKKGLVGYRYVNRSVSATQYKNRESDQ